MTEPEIVDGWKQANISRVISEMQRYGLTLEDIAEALRMQAPPREVLVACTTGAVIVVQAGPDT